MTTKNFNCNEKFIVIFLFFISNIFADESAQQILQKIYKKNDFNDGYYDGNITILLPYKKKEVYEFSMLKKDKSVFWEVKKQEQMRFRILCKNELNEIYIYDKLRDLLKRFQQQDIMKIWNYSPVFLYCNVPLETILDPQKKEIHNNEILILNNFFVPNINYTSILHIDISYQFKKMMIFKKQKDINDIEFRIFYFYDEPISVLKENQIEPLKTEYPTKLEIIDAKNRNVIKIHWIYFHPNYKIDDIRFMPEFISR